VSLSFLLGDKGENGVWGLPPLMTSSLIHTPILHRPLHSRPRFCIVLASAVCIITETSHHVWNTRIFFQISGET
jgi:hypothetical protein